MVLDPPHEPVDVLAAAARQLQSAGSADDLLTQIVDIAVATIEGSAYAGISVDRGGRAQSPVVSDPAVLMIDALQYSIGEGPCLAAMRGPDVFVDAPDLEHDARFGTFGPEAARQGCRAVLAHRLYVDSQTLGSLNLYAQDAGSYTDEDRRRSVVLAALASLALNAMRLEADSEGLHEALRSRDVIGQAKGVLMEREGLSEDDAFERLRQMSQAENRKLRDVADHLVETRQWPPAPDTPAS
jgi:GAF domain-containing protein